MEGRRRKLKTVRAGVLRGSPLYLGLDRFIKSYEVVRNIFKGRNVLVQNEWTDVVWIGSMFLAALKIYLQLAHDKDTYEGNLKSKSKAARPRAHQHSETKTSLQHAKTREGLVTRKGPLEPSTRGSRGLFWLHCVGTCLLP